MELEPVLTYFTPGNGRSVVFASHTVIGGDFVVGSHHLAREFRRRGHRVCHISTPVSLAHLARIGDAGIRRRLSNWIKGGRVEYAGVTNYVPFAILPWQLTAGIFRKTGWNPAVLCLPPIEKVIQRCGIRAPVDLLLVDQPRLCGISHLLRASIVVYRATDLEAGMSGSGAELNVHRRLAGEAHGLVATSSPVLEQLRELAPHKPHLLLENGVEFEHFALPAVEPPEYRALASPRAVYCGALDGRFDRRAIEVLAEKMPELQIVLIGPIDSRDRRRFQSPGNIHALGPVDYGRLPGYLQHADVGLLPLDDHPVNAGRSPMKFYEYAAAGLPVVARSTREILRRNEPFVRTYSDTADMANAVAEVLRGSHADKRDIVESARAHSWKSKADRLIDFINSLATAVRPEA